MSEETQQQETLTPFDRLAMQELDRLKAREVAQRAFQEMKTQEAVAEAGSADNPRAIIDWTEFWIEDEPEAEWLIPGVIQVGQQGCVYSRPGVGKSLYVAEQAFLLAIEKGIPVLYIDQENSHRDLRSRLSAMGYGPATDLTNMKYSLLGSWPPLNTPEGGKAVHDFVGEHEIRLVVVDTTSRVVEGDSHHGDTITALWNYTQVELKRQEVTFIRIDHSNKSDGLIGSIMKQADLDVLWRMTPAGTHDGVILECEKDRSGVIGLGTKIALTRQQNPLRHVVPTAMNDPKAWEKIERENEMLETLDRLGVARSAGRDVVTKALKEAGVKTMSATDMQALVRYRQTGAIAASADTDDDSF